MLSSSSRLRFLEPPTLVPSRDDCAENINCATVKAAVVRVLLLYLRSRPKENVQYIVPFHADSTCVEDQACRS